MFRSKQFIFAFLVFVIIQILLYTFISLFHPVVPFEQKLYLNDSHHYVQDARATGGEFSLLRALGVWDAQWYLRIADDGYPSKDVFNKNAADPRFMGGLTYAFFPLYPLVLSIVSLLFRDTELTAFVVSNLLLVANFISIYYIVTKLYSRDMAIRTAFLLFLFPFSIFYRSYFTEGLFLLLLVWFAYFLIKNKWFYATVLVSLLFVTRPNGAFMGLIFLPALFKGIMHKKISLLRTALYVCLSIIPFAIWCYYTYVLTDNAFYWHKVQSVWFSSPSLGFTFVSNIERIFSFMNYPIHTARESKIDILMVLATLGLLIWSKKFFKKYPQLWWISLAVWIAPLLLKDLMSYSRYQIVSFPLFLFLAYKVTGWKFYVLSALFLGLLLFTSLYFINWQWVG